MPRPMEPIHEKEDTAQMRENIKIDMRMHLVKRIVRKRGGTTTFTCRV